MAFLRYLPSLTALGLAASLHLADAGATTALAWGDSTGSFGLATNRAGKAAASQAALEDCRRRGGGNDCKLVKLSDEPGFGALYETCIASHCRVRVATGGLNRFQAHQMAHQDCRDFHASATCMPLADWEEFAVFAPARGAGETRNPYVTAGAVLDAAESKDPDAEYVVGKSAYWHEDYNEALYWLVRAAEHGSGEARAALGIMYLYGRGVAPDFGKGARLIEMAERQAPTLAARYSGDADDSPTPGPDLRLAGKYAALEESAYLGMVKSQSALGTYYREGRNGVRKDPVRARFWLAKAAEGGDPAAQYYLGIDLFYGNPGFEQDRERGFELLKKSANQDFSLAQTFMGVILAARNHREHALAYFRKAARQGEATAMRKLEEMGENW